MKKLRAKAVRTNPPSERTSELFSTVWKGSTMLRALTLGFHCHPSSDQWPCHVTDSSGGAGYWKDTQVACSPVELIIGTWRTLLKSMIEYVQQVCVLGDSNEVPPGVWQVGALGELQLSRGGLLVSESLASSGVQNALNNSLVKAGITVLPVLGRQTGESLGLIG